LIRWWLPWLAVGLVLYLARSILPPFIVAGVLAYIFSPVVDRLQQRTALPRLAVAGALYVVLLGLLGLGVMLLETRLVSEVQALARAGPDLVDVAFVRLLGQQTFQFFGQTVDPHFLALWTNQQLAEIVGRPSDAFHIAERAVETILKVILTLLALFYLILDGKRFGRFLLRFVEPGLRPRVSEVAGRIHLVLGSYLRGQLFLVLLMSCVTYVMLTFVFHLPYALPLALATGILEVIPIVGPWAAGTLAAIVALVNGGPGVLLGVAAGYFVLRMTEDQFVMPIVVGRAVHLHPLVTIFAVLLGGNIAGVLGAVLAVPVAAILRVTLDYVFPSNDDATSESARARPEAAAAARKLS
jgi:predicted PurR-regulated permease PerM